MQKKINREGQEAAQIFNDRNLDSDYPTIKPLLREGMKILDIGCGTGAITKDIAKLIGSTGKIIGIDNTLDFINNGKLRYAEYKNMELIHADLFDYKPQEKFDLIICARVVQWLYNPLEAIEKMKSFLESNGILSVLDYNHEKIEWNPSPPISMLKFYNTFLKWREEAGMDNCIADNLKEYFSEAGIENIEVNNSDEYYDKNSHNFKSKVGVWTKVAGSSQMVEEGYLDDDLRINTILEYEKWTENEAISMTMKLNEVRGISR
ncbi:bifunctional 2-polyprenyl-6-hydroxyphenol methylase/3-demethylubiquinol 3-O-methyltransferase UbiG [Chryseobacterium sp. ERMR1:04]|uniref:class I SAM-dependent methyltransferase n=1 Tax=Chryseobacterium sp. ERMR1:04 TaxID=1705393 RepID=UPI0006C88A40|nr:class I SAM-dependent methyltransferase [Chryseobacterium sp. ERMR1:04]KPH14200.1 methyltransferase [Chryseobacterium sp. ERMR1:04]